MEFVFEILFQFLGEIILQAIFEALFELGLHSLADTFKRPKSPILSTIGFILWGAIAGGISLLIFPHSPIRNSDFRTLNLVVTPVIVGLMMMLIGKFRDKRGQALVRIDRFGYGFIFAFAMALARYIGVN